MNIQVALLPELLSPGSGFTAVVIDTLRFTTTACQGLVAGAREICVAADIDEIRSLAKQDSEGSLLCGERQGYKLRGFDLGNSPFEYTAPTVVDKTLYFTTTNGTRAISAACHADSIWLAALVNRQAIVDALLEKNPSRVQIVCAGTDRQIALEDLLAAGAIVAALGNHPNSSEAGICLEGDGAQLALRVWQSLESDNTQGFVQQHIYDIFCQATGGRNLIDAGFAKDLSFASELDSIPIVPVSRADHWRRFRRLESRGKA